jgi:hypothetical protein
VRLLHARSAANVIKTAVAIALLFAHSSVDKEGVQVARLLKVPGHPILAIGSFGLTKAGKELWYVWIDIDKEELWYVNRNHG